MGAAIRAYPDPVLREVCRPVGIEQHATLMKVRELVMMLRETVHDHRGYGLAAPQIGVPVRVFIVHVPTETFNPLVFINPEIVSYSAEHVELNEGCLSFAGIWHPISRPASVTVKRYTEHGRIDTSTFDKWSARAIQHEMEHLDGKLLVDHMMPAARRMLDRSLKRKADKRAAKRGNGAAVVEQPKEIA